jgi:hypothetical protein
MEHRDLCADDMWTLSALGDSARLVLEGLARSPVTVQEDDATVAARLGISRFNVASVLALLHGCGWLLAGAGGRRSFAVGPESLTALAERIQGYVDGRRASERRMGTVTPIVTLPKTSTVLRGHSGALPESYATRDGFTYVAGRAARRLVFLMPFMDQEGVHLIVDMMKTCKASQRVLISRPDSRGYRSYLRHLPLLNAAGVEVMEYWHRRPDGESPAAETFHAKLVFADDHLAYVGSSNLMVSSLVGGLECGVILDGPQARPFRDIVDCVLRASVPVHV